MRDKEEDESIRHSIEGEREEESERGEGEGHLICHNGIRWDDYGDSLDEVDLHCDE